MQIKIAFPAMEQIGLNSQIYGHFGSPARRFWWPDLIGMLETGPDWFQSGMTWSVICCQYGQKRRLHEKTNIYRLH